MLETVASPERHLSDNDIEEERNYCVLAAQTAERLAKDLGIDDFTAEVSPADKQSRVTGEKKQGRVVAMRHSPDDVLRTEGTVPAEIYLGMG